MNGRVAAVPGAAVARRFAGVDFTVACPGPTAFVGQPDRGMREDRKDIHSRGGSMTDTPRSAGAASARALLSCIARRALTTGT
jgi:hypothetical protein